MQAAIDTQSAISRMFLTAGFRQFELDLIQSAPPAHSAARTRRDVYNQNPLGFDRTARFWSRGPTRTRLAAEIRASG
jgi:hypothetical protein